MRIASSHRRAAAIEARVLRRFEPPPMLTVSEWADRYRYLSPEASAEPGRWSTDRAPYLRDILDAFSDPTIETVVVMSGSQVGKTEVLLNVLGYHIHQDPAPILMLQPTVEMGAAFSKDRLAPMLRDSPALRGKVAPVKSRDSGNTILHKSFPGGHVTIAGANSAAGLASRPIRVLLSDEVDRFPASAGSEGDPVALATRRTATFWNRKIGLVSTPTLKGFSRIEEAYSEGDRRKLWLPCLECGEYFLPRWSNVSFQDRDPETAGMACEHCGALHEEADKPAMLARLEWRAEEPGGRVASFHLPGLVSPWAQWRDQVGEFLQAKSNPERLRVWVNTILGETWEEEGDRVNSDELRDRFAGCCEWCETEELGALEYDVPNGVGIITASVDVQDDRLELLIKGWGRGEESWVLVWDQLWGDPGQELVWANLDEILGRRFRHASGEELPIMSLGIDSQGHHTEQVYRWVRKHQRRRVFAIKGMGGEGRALIGRPSKKNKAGLKLFPVGTHTAKDLIFSRLRILEAGPGYMHLPAWLDEEYLEQLTAEKVVTRYTRGRPKRVYEPTRRRNEALDLEVYALAALAHLGPSIYNNLGKWVDKVSTEEEEDGGQEDGRGLPRGRTPRGMQRRTGWVNRWRE